MSVLDRFYKGDIRALSRIVSFVENRESGYRTLLGKLYSGVGRSVRLGITGPPGSGKSTLVNRLVDKYLKAGKRVGVVAVDPTSPYTGGALLGDRVRMGSFPMDGSFYFRSMATRGAAGGLAASTGNVTVIYDAFGFDITVVETVGVGQVELDVVDACDTVAVVLVPESGDAVQTMKAGLMEIADIFAVNKADRSGAERIAAELESTLDTRKKTEGAWTIPIVLTEAVNNKNIDRLYQAIGEHIAFQKKNGQFESHRRQQIQKKILSLLQNRFQQEFLEKLDIQAQFDRVADEIFAGKTNPYEISDKLYHQFRSDSTP